MRTTPAGTAGVDSRRQHRFAAALPHLDLRALGDADLLQRERVHPRPRRLRVGRLLQRRRAPHERIGEVDRHVGDALEALSGRLWALAIGDIGAIAELRRDARRPCGSEFARRRRSIRTRSRAARASIPARAAPSTRDACSPNGLTTPLKRCTRPSQLTNVPRGLGERADRQQRRRHTACRAGTATCTTTKSAFSSAARAATGFAQSNSGSAPRTMYALRGSASIARAFMPPVCGNASAT